MHGRRAGPAGRRKSPLTLGGKTTMNNLNVLLALGAWIVAGVQFLVSIRETRRKHGALALGHIWTSDIRRSAAISWRCDPWRTRRGETTRKAGC